MMPPPLQRQSLCHDGPPAVTIYLVSGPPHFWCPGTDRIGLVVFAAVATSSRASGPEHSWRCDGLLPRRFSHRCWPLQSGALHQDFGACARSVGRFCAGQLVLRMAPTMLLRCLDCLALRTRNRACTHVKSVQQPSRPPPTLVL